MKQNGSVFTCILCKVNPFKSHNLLCGECTTLIQQNKELMSFYKSLMADVRLEKLQFRDKLIRKNPTRASKKAKKIIKSIAWRIFGLKVKEEVPFGPFFVDFHFQGTKIAIEIDGGYHEERQTYDLKRDAFLSKAFGLEVYRFWNDDVGKDYFKDAIFDICVKLLNEKLVKHGHHKRIDIVGVNNGCDRTPRFSFRCQI